MDTWLLSVECASRDGVVPHRQCFGYSRAGVGLVARCLCACHFAAVSPPEPPSAERAERLRADWATGLFRLVDLARRYSVAEYRVRDAIYHHSKEV